MFRQMSVPYCLVYQASYGGIYGTGILIKYTTHHSVQTVLKQNTFISSGLRTACGWRGVGERYYYVYYVILQPTQRVVVVVSDSCCRVHLLSCY